MVSINSGGNPGPPGGPPQRPPGPPSGLPAPPAASRPPPDGPGLLEQRGAGDRTSAAPIMHDHGLARARNLLIFFQAPGLPRGLPRGLPGGGHRGGRRYKAPNL
jgi:hypothetical protein